MTPISPHREYQQCRRMPFAWHSWMATLGDLPWRSPFTHAYVPEFKFTEALSSLGWVENGSNQEWANDIESRNRIEWAPRFHGSVRKLLVNIISTIVYRDDRVKNEKHGVYP